MNPTLELYLCPKGHRIRIDPAQPNLIVKKCDHGYAIIENNKPVMVSGVFCKQCQHTTYTMEELTPVSVSVPPLV